MTALAHDLIGGCRLVILPVILECEKRIGDVEAV